MEEKTVKEMFIDRINAYLEGKNEAVELRKALKQEKLSEYLILKKINREAYCELGTLKCSGIFIDDFIKLLGIFLDETIDESKVHYAEISSKKIHCLRIEGQKPDDCSELLRKPYFNCIVYKEYAFLLDRGFNTLLYLDLDEVDVKQKEVNIIIGHDNDFSYLLCLSKKGVKIQRAENYGKPIGEHLGKILFESSTDNITGPELISKINEYRTSSGSRYFSNV